MRKTLPYRAWYYFRMGYSQYFIFVFSILNMLTLTYYLAIGDGELEFLFPSFLSYVMVFTMVVIPILCVVGYLHLRRSYAYSSDIDVAAEANPYNYKLPPGIVKDCVIPLYQETLRLLRDSLVEKGADTGGDVAKLRDLYKKFDLLKEGGSLPHPKKFDVI